MEEAMPQHVTVTESNPIWPQLYRKEKAAIRTVLEDEAIAIYHIGSTSVPGLAAKPIIDMMVVVRDVDTIDRRKEAFESIGYEWMGEFGIPGRRYLRKGGDERTHQIHIFGAVDRRNISRHLAFRDYLRKHTREREEYGILKKRLAECFPYDIEAYCDGKDAFVKEVESKAVAEYDGVWDELFIRARMAQGERSVSPFIEAGSVAAALITDRGNSYTGVCIDTACSLGMCAERSAIAAMITGGENRIERIAIVLPDGSQGMPCGACQELMMQLSRDSGSIRILTDAEERTETTLSSLMNGRWWGSDRYQPAP